MKAIVRNIKYNTEVKDDDHGDIFVMSQYIGKHIEVKQQYLHWYFNSMDNTNWNWHESWLCFEPYICEECSRRFQCWTE